MGDKQTLMIQGTKVCFPVKPYPSQMAMMAQILKGLKKCDNCLLESPTGTGKSLALLCATLAWQKAEEDRVQRYNSLIDQGITDPDILNQVWGSGTSTSARANPDERTPSTPQTEPRGPSLSTPGPQQEPQPQNTTTQPTPSTQTTSATTSSGSTQEGGFIRADPNLANDDIDDFKDAQSNFRVVQELSVNEHGVGDLNGTDVGVHVAVDENRPRRKRTPKIYFGTRTHKQIYQIIKELRTTEYKDVRSVVLGSREHTCIHPLVSASKNKNEGCKTLLENKNNDFCSYYHGATRLKTQDQLTGYGLPSPWDLEDLVKAGKRAKACPYYTARHFMETGQIIFCPYNYLIDPLIRKSMSLDLRSAILVLDEAHNVEDSSREAASASLTQEAILESKNDLERLIFNGAKTDSCRPLILMLSRLGQWMEANKEKLTDISDFGKTGKIFSGAEIVEQMSHLDIDPKSLTTLEKCLNQFSEDSEQEKEEVAKPTSATSALLSSFFLMLRFLFQNEMKNVDDYKVALLRAQTFSSGGFHTGADGWIKRRSSQASSIVYSLNFWCLNPGVAFSELGDLTRSIILTSGTLSPMNSFASELQVKFPIHLEANHVIQQDQVWVGTIGRGPTNQPLNATYKCAESWDFQDELGRMVLSVCESMPRGILCFLPSYTMMGKLVDRWRSCSLWEEIEARKRILIEPRGGEEFGKAMTLFYDTIRDTRDCSEGEQNGALFIAVCRGKVSEGLDFTDDNARAVIAVGIPFPNAKDVQVNLKKKYNDLYCKSKGLLTGRDWYEIQAYRALNQALGRCIRHKSDWGAIILVDERYQKYSHGGASTNPYVKNLSKWVRSSLHHHPVFNSAMSELKYFAKRMTENSTEPRVEIPEKNTLSIMETPKPKFASPPKFPDSINGDKSENQIPKTPTSATRFTFKSKTETKDIVLCMKNTNLDTDVKTNAKLLLSPVNDDLGLPLTPISNTWQGASYPNSANVVFPLTSTQNLVLPSSPNVEVVGFVNRRKTTLTTTPKSEKSQKNAKPIKSKNQWLISQFWGGNSSPAAKVGNVTPCSHSPISHSPSQVEATSKDDVYTFTEDENISDDMFAGHCADHAPSSKAKSTEKTDSKRKGSRKRSLDTTSKLKGEDKVDVGNTSVNFSPSLLQGNDSDLEDFNMNTSLVRSSAKPPNSKKKDKRKKKGVVFTDYHDNL